MVHFFVDGNWWDDDDDDGNWWKLMELVGNWWDEDEEEEEEEEDDDDALVNYQRFGMDASTTNSNITMENCLVVEELLLNIVIFHNIYIYIHIIAMLDYQGLVLRIPSFFHPWDHMIMTPMCTWIGFWNHQAKHTSALPDYSTSESWNHDIWGSQFSNEFWNSSTTLPISYIYILHGL